MDNKNNVFFGEKGLTETSANFIANLAKELLRKDEKDLENMNFLHTEVSFIGQPNKNKLTLGMEEEEFWKIPAKVERVVRLKSLIAWLREAIKAKQALHTQIDKLGDEDIYTKELGNELPTYEELPDPLSEDEYIATLTIGERCKIFSLKTRAAQLGKLIHEEGALAVAREKLHDVIKEPSEVRNIGANALVYYREPSIEEKEVDALYFELQSKYRSVQSELNSYLHRIDEAVKASNRNYAEKCKEMQKARYDANELIRTSAGDWKLKEHGRISALKIVIPHELEEIYKEVQSVG